MNPNEIVTAPVDDDGHHLRKPILEHFQDLLVHVRRSFYWLIAACSVTYLGAERLVRMLKAPMERAALEFPLERRPEIIITRPFEEMWTYLRLAAFLGVFLALPFILFEIAAFVGPGLKTIERKRIRTLILSFYVVFLLGLYLSYEYILGLVLHAVMNYGGGMQSLKWTLSSYSDTALGVIVAFAILLELPVVMVYLTMWGWVDAATWSKGRKLALVANSLISAVLSPPDVVSMLVMMVPMQLLYELGIILSRLVAWKNKDRQNVA